MGAKHVILSRLMVEETKASNFTYCMDATNIMRGLIAQNRFCAMIAYCTELFCAITAYCTIPVAGHLVVRDY